MVLLKIKKFLIDEKAIQFNFKTNWNSLIKPMLYDNDLQDAIDEGVKQFAINETGSHDGIKWNSGDAPYELGRGPLNNQVAIEGELSWYQPWGNCHWIAPFTKRIGERLYPYLHWDILYGDIHTVSIGRNNETGSIMVVMDINYFSKYDVLDSINMVRYGTR